MLTIILLLSFATAGLIGFALVPAMADRAAVINERRQQSYSLRLEQLMPRQEAKKITRILLITPLVFAAGFLFLFPEDMRLWGGGIGFIGGIIFPQMYLSILKDRSRQKFHDQLIDALMIMSSSFRGGLSLIQAIEAVVDEMPDPVNKELGMVLAENKMGVSLEESLNHLYNRMPSPALQQMLTAILLARETGGNLPVIFKRIVGNIREHKKVQQNLDTLTIQGRIQGIVMSFLPVAFGYIVYTSNRRIFEHMFHSEMGKFILLYCVVSWMIGVFLIWKISSFKDF